MALSQKEQQQINTLVGRFEADTGIQAVAAVVDRADAYPELPWKAYAIGSALGAFAIVLFPHRLLDWSEAATLVPALGRLVLDRVRAEGEARQSAAVMFLEREIFRTSARRAVLLFLSRAGRWLLPLLPLSSRFPHRL